MSNGMRSSSSGISDELNSSLRIRTPGALGQPRGGSRTAGTWVAYPAGMGISIGGLGVRAEVSGAGNRV